MGIQGYTTVGSPLGPNSTLDTYATHEDAFGKGGYRAITTQGSGAVAIDSDINDVIPWRRRAVGMLVYDTRTTTYYRLGTLGTEPGGFGYGGQSLWEVEDFGGEGSVTEVRMTVPGGLAVTPSEITSEGTFAITLDGLNSIVKSDGANLTNATVSNDGTAADVAAGQHTQGYGSITGLGSGAKLLGHTTTGSGAAQLITIGQGLQLEGNQLKSLDAGGTVTSIAVAPTGVLTSNTSDLGQTYLITHANSGVTAGTFGAAGTVPVVSVNATGHVTSVTTATITGFLPTAGGTLTGALSGTTASFSGALTVEGNLTVNGEQTIVNSNTVQVVDRNIELAINATTDSEANAGGITLHGLQDKSFRWLLATDSWTSSEHVELATGKAFRIDGAQVMSKTALGSTVVDSSLTSVGTLTGGTWQATSIGLAYGGTGANLSSAVTGTIFKKGASNALIAAVVDEDYLNQNSVIDGGTY